MSNDEVNHSITGEKIEKGSDDDLKQNLDNKSEGVELNSNKLEDGNSIKMKSVQKEEPKDVPQDVPVHISHMKEKNVNIEGGSTSEIKCSDSTTHDKGCKIVEHVVPPCIKMRMQKNLRIDNSIVPVETNKVKEYPQQCNGLQKGRRGKHPPKVNGLRRVKSTQKQKKMHDFDQPLSQGFNDFDISRTKALADIEKNLNRQHKRLLEQSKNDMNKSYGNKSDVHEVKKSTKKCALCLTCSCSKGSSLRSLEKCASSETNIFLRGLARSDAEIETALIARLARLEKSASWFDHLCSKTSRELKRHRTKLVKKKVEREGTGVIKEKAWFLHDLDDKAFDANLQISANPLPESMVHEAAEKVFAFRRKCQPTLTQMIESDESKEGEIKGCGGDESTLDGNKNERSFNDHSIDKYKVKEALPLDIENALDRGKDGLLWEASRNCNDIKKACMKNRRQLITHCDDDTESNFNVIDSLLTESEDSGIDQLLHIFENSEQTDDEEIDEVTQPKTFTKNENSHHLPVTISQLTPLGREISRSIEESITSDATKLEILNLESPNWRENIRFAFNGKSPLELRSALSKIKSRRQKVDQKRQQILQLLQREDTILEFYESILSSSISMK